jgi:peptide/nickel transport system permease protein
MTLLKRILTLILHPRAKLSGLSSLADGRETVLEEQAPALRGSRLRLRDVLLNLPFLVGVLIVFALFLLVLFGPIWAPENPYLSGQSVKRDAASGVIELPPLPPSHEFPLGTDQWGNDMLSLLLHGARNTLIACAFITMVRVLLGLVLGGLAGWNEGSGIDQVIMGSIGVITAVPMLISSMLLIYGLDIRRGLPVFIIALSAVGWTEIAQYIRSEFLVLRKMPFIDGARAVGSTGFALAVRHILPNVLPQLLVIACLEMGAVMMLLGELGFIGVYIGGGSRISLDLSGTDTVTIYTLAETPEWGAILAGGFRFLRTKPFVVFPPAIGFFISVVGFNTLGEGLRRLIEQSGINTAVLLRKRTLAAIGALSLATVFIINRSGPAPWFAKVAQSFSGEAAFQHVQALTEMDGRRIGQNGGLEAAAYIAEQFEANGLEPGWQHQSYIYPFQTNVVHPLEQPSLELIGDDDRKIQEFHHQLDFGYLIEGHAGSGSAEANVVFVGFLPAAESYTPESFKGMDLRGRIVLALEDNIPPDFAVEALIRGAEGILLVSNTSNPNIRSQIHYPEDPADHLRNPTIPIFRIRAEIGQAILDHAGITLNELFGEELLEGQDEASWITRDLSIKAKMSLTLAEPEEVAIPQVLGFMPGSDFDLADDLVVIFATYDSLGVDPDGTIFPGANHSASSVGVMLEIVRLWHEQNLDARRSVLFVAWGGGNAEDFGAKTYLSDGGHYRRLPTRNPSSRLALNSIFFLDDLGAGSDALELHPRSSDELARLIQETTAEVGIPISFSNENDWSYDDLLSLQMNWVYFRWTGGYFPPTEDTLDNIDVEKMQKVGEALALALTKIVRQTMY